MITFVKGAEKRKLLFNSDSYFLPSSKNKKGVNAKKTEKENTDQNFHPIS